MKNPKNVFLFALIFILCDFLTGTIYSARLPQKIRIPSDIFHHGLRANARAVETWGTHRSEILTNSLGFRDSRIRDISLKKNSKRLIVIGDSFAEGVGVDYEKTFAGILARELGKENIEVLNAGVVSYFPKLYRDKLRYWIDRGLEADEVAVFLDLSDIPDEAEAEIPFTPGRSEILKNKIRSALIEHSVLLRFLFFLKHRFVDLPRRNAIITAHNAWRIRWASDPEAFEKFGKRGLELARRHMEELHDYLKQKNIRMTLAVYPRPDEILHPTSEHLQQNYWREWCRENQVPFLNLIPVFINAGPAEETAAKYFIPGDVHWNAQGHALVAETFLREKQRPLQETTPAVR